MSQTTLLALFSDQDLPLVPWALALDENRCGEGVVLLSVTAGDQYRLQKSNAAGEDGPELLREVWTVLPEDRGRIEVLDCRARNLARAVLVAAAELGPELLVLHGDFGALPRDAAAAVQRLARVAPFDVLLLDPEGTPGPAQVLIAQVQGAGGHAIRAAVEGFGVGETQVRAVVDPANPGRSQRNYERARERCPKSRRDRLSLIEPEEDLATALAHLLRPHDLLLIDANEQSPLRPATQLLRNLREAQPSLHFSVGITRKADAAGQGRLGRFIEKLRTHLPRLDRERRVAVHELLESGGQLSADFVVMLTLSTAIACLGLIQSSTAVVVGAMLVAPLMTPIIAMGMGLVQANPQLFRRAAWATTLGIIAALGTAACIALCSPWDDLSAEVVARGAPNLFDLAIALFSGIAGAYAISRPGAMGALVGVAIAVALVPPLASLAIASVKGVWDIALGAGVLFLTNLFAIVAGSTLVFRGFGLDASLRGRAWPAWVRVATVLLLLCLVPIVAVLLHNLQDQMRQGVARDYARPLSQDLRHALRARVAKVPGLQIVIMARSDIEDGFGVKLVLASPGAEDAAVTKDLRAILQAHLGPDQALQVLWLRGAAPR